MARIASVGPRLAEHLADGRIATRAELEAAGFSSAALSRLLSSGMLERVGSRGVMLATAWEGDMMAPAARFYGGLPDSPRGLVWMRSAAILHELTDLEQHQAGGVEIAVPQGVSHRPKNLEVCIARCTRPSVFALDGLEWRTFGGFGIHVTTPGRTVCDLFSPWRPDSVDDAFATEALARLIAVDRPEAERAVGFAQIMGWGRTVAQAHDAAIAGISWNGGGMR
jgi:hypothetical protein